MKALRYRRRSSAASEISALSAGDTITAGISPTWSDSRSYSLPLRLRTLPPLREKEHTTPSLLPASVAYCPSTRKKSAPWRMLCASVICNDDLHIDR